LVGTFHGKDVVIDRTRDIRGETERAA
jgi:hypothetical protein